MERDILAEGERVSKAVRAHLLVEREPVLEYAAYARNRTGR